MKAKKLADSLNPPYLVKGSDANAVSSKVDSSTQTDESFIKSMSSQTDNPAKVETKHGGEKASPDADAAKQNVGEKPAAPGRNTPTAIKAGTPSAASAAKPSSRMKPGTSGKSCSPASKAEKTSGKTNPEKPTESASAKTERSEKKIRINRNGGSYPPKGSSDPIKEGLAIHEELKLTSSTRRYKGKAPTTEL